MTASEPDAPARVNGVVSAGAAPYSPRPRPTANGEDGGPTPSPAARRGAIMCRVIRVAVLDDHPAVLAGLRRLLDVADGIVAVAAVDDAEDLLRALGRARADVAILDYDLGRGNGLAVCQRLKERMCPPGVVVYSAYAGPALVLAARIAGADAVVDKRAPVGDLIDAIRGVAAGEPALPDIPFELHQALVAGLASDEIAVAGMLLAGASPHGVAEALSIDRREVANRTRRIVARLRPKSKPYDAASTRDRARSQQSPSRRHVEAPRPCAPTR